MKKRIGRVLLVMAVVLLSCMPVYAAEELKKNMVMETTEEVKLLEQADEEAKEIATLPAGVVVLLVEDSQNGWCKVSAQEKTGYLQTSQLKTLGNADDLNAEFDKIGDTVRLIFDEIVVRENEQRQAKIWGIVIVVLIAAIFGVGIISAVKKNKDEEQKENEQEEKTQEE